MSPDHLYTLKELSEVSGYSEATLREFIHTRGLAAIRSGKRGWFRVEHSAWEAWKANHKTSEALPPIVVELNPPKHAPSKPKPVDVKEFMPKDFKAPFAWSA